VSRLSRQIREEFRVSGSTRSVDFSLGSTSRQCLGKRRLRNYDVAERVAKSDSVKYGQPMRPYYCGSCLSYHLTKSPLPFADVPNTRTSKVEPQVSENKVRCSFFGKSLKRFRTFHLAKSAFRCKQAANPKKHQDRNCFRCQRCKRVHLLTFLLYLNNWSPKSEDPIEDSPMFYRLPLDKVEELLALSELTPLVYFEPQPLDSLAGNPFFYAKPIP